PPSPPSDSTPRSLWPTPPRPRSASWPRRCWPRTCGCSAWPRACLFLPAPALAHPAKTTVGELAETVLAEDLRLQRLAEDLLLLTRADEHTLALHRRPGDLAALARAASL